MGVTGYGVAEACAAAMAHCCLEVAGAGVIIQGFGAVGVAAAARLAALGTTIVAVSTAVGGPCNPDGLEVAAMTAAGASVGNAFVSRWDNGGNTRLLEPGEELFLDTDVLIPAAMQGVIDPDIAGQLKAKLIVEGANLPASRWRSTCCTSGESPWSPTSSPSPEGLWQQRSPWRPAPRSSP